MLWQVFVIFLYFINISLATDPSSCATYIKTNDDTSIDWTSNIYWNSEINDNDTLQKIFPLTNTIVVSNITGNGTPYIDVATDGVNLIFFSYSNFTAFDEDIPKQISDTVDLTLTVQLRCASTQLTTLTFIQTIRDANDHPPLFKQMQYEYNIPMPLAPRIDLTSLSQEIIATDLDFSNQDVTFTLDSSDGEFWELETISSSDSKDYRAILTVTEFTRLSGDTILTLTATDSGTPPLSSTTTIKITIDENASLVEVPSFSASLYRYTYSGNVSVSLISNSTIYLHASNSADVKITLDDIHFAVEYDVNTQEAEIVVVEPIGLSKDPVVVVTLTASLISHPEAITKSIILIDVPSLCGPLTK